MVSRLKIICPRANHSSDIGDLPNLLLCLRDPEFDAIGIGGAGDCSLGVPKS